MSMNVLVVLVLLGLILRSARWRRTGSAALVLAAALFIVEGCGWLPAWLLHGLQAPYAQRPAIAWAPRNAIVLLGAGTVHPPGGAVEPALFANGRINEALAIYRECKASGNSCRLEVSGGDALHTGQPEATVYGKLLVRLGVPADDLLLEPRSMNTWENAEFSAPLLRAYGAERVVLVSSATHLRRASLYFRHFGIDVTPVRADWLSVHTGWWPRSWAFAMTDLALHEYYGVFRYHVYEALGWNVHATRPGAP
ncbi:MAG TPA: YdcF family protein [Rhodanobacteraceae bacterium]